MLAGQLDLKAWNLPKKLSRCAQVIPVIRKQKQDLLESWQCSISSLWIQKEKDPDSVIIIWVWGHPKWTSGLHTHEHTHANYTLELKTACVGYVPSDSVSHLKEGLDNSKINKSCTFK